MGELIVETGPPGAGKSTVASILADQFDPSVLVRGDDFFGFIARGLVPPWTREAQPQNSVVIDAAAAASGKLAREYTVVYDGVLGPWFVEEFLEAAGLDHAHYAVLLPPEATCLERVRHRRGHGFTDLDATRTMYAEFARSEIDPQHLLVATGEPEALAAEIARLVDAGTILRPLARGAVPRRE